MSIKTHLSIVLLAATLSACGGCEPASEQEQQAALVAIVAAQQQGNQAQQLTASANYQALVEQCD